VALDVDCDAGFATVSSPAAEVSPLVALLSTVCAEANAGSRSRRHRELVAKQHETTFPNPPRFNPWGVSPVRSAIFTGKKNIAVLTLHEAYLLGPFHHTTINRI
jgi:hypothetical protein